MRHLQAIRIQLCTLLLSATTSAFAQGGRVGDRIPEFQLQSTDGTMQGIRYADNLVSVIHLIGYD